MMNRILQGENPSAVFKGMLRENPLLTNADISAVFKEEFEAVSNEAMHVIWHWKRPDSSHGAEDGRVDELLRHYLKEAGYM